MKMFNLSNKIWLERYFWILSSDYDKTPCLQPTQLKPFE